MKKSICITLSLLIVLSLCACNTVKDNEYKTRSRTISNHYFNTFSMISTYADDNDETIEEYLKVADETLSYYHRLFDIYNDYDGLTNIKSINDNAGVSPVAVDEELIVFLEYCKELYTITRGKTNVMLGSVLKLWHECREMATDNLGYLDPGLLPDGNELGEAERHTDIDSLVIDKDARTVYISDPLASIDVGAVAKGYAVDMLYRELKAMGADSVAINVGGNLRTIGLKPSGEKWVSGITNPDRSSDESLAMRVEIGECSVVTSGDYERYFISGDLKYHHVIDPETLYPARYFSSVSIFTESSALADALSTALFCMSYEEGAELISSIDGVDVVWIDLSYGVRYTDGVAPLPAVGK